MGQEDGQEKDVAPPLFPEPGPLPRGPHQLSREQVNESQRTRLLKAFTELMAEQGFDGVKIGELAARAGVSRSTFYDHFDDKNSCLLAAYERFAARIAGALAPQIDDGAPWGTFVRALIDGYLGALQADLTAARAFIVEMDGAGAAARTYRRQAAEAFAVRLAARHALVRKRDRSLGALPHGVYLALALAARSLVHDLLESEPAPELRKLAPDLFFLSDAVVHGASAARSDARGQKTSGA